MDLTRPEKGGSLETDRTSEKNSTQNKMLPADH